MREGEETNVEATCVTIGLESKCHVWILLLLLLLFKVLVTEPRDVY